MEVGGDMGWAVDGGGCGGDGVKVGHPHSLIVNTQTHRFMLDTRNAERGEKNNEGGRKRERGRERESERGGEEK